jgi:hypothetical protein
LEDYPMLRIFVVIMAVSLPLSAVVAGERQVLSGNASGDLPPGEYVVRSAVVVRKGEAFRVQAGTTLYFEQLAGITVFGELSVDGELYDPVVFTSLGGGADDGAGPGFHWNGVEAEGAEAVVRMRRTRISGSVYGVNVKDFGAKADLADVVFDNNGYASLMIGGQEVPVAAGEPVSVLWEMGAKVSAAGDMPVTKSGKDGKPRAEGQRRLALRGSALGVASVGAILCGVNVIRARGGFKNYAAEDDPYKSSVYREDAKRSMAVGGIGAAIAGAGLLCVGLTVFF